MRKLVGEEVSSRGLGAHFRTMFLILGSMAIGLSVTACDGLLDVRLPGEIEAVDLREPGMAAMVMRGVQADFECGFAQYTVLSGVVSRIFMDAQTVTDLIPYSQRNLSPGHSNYNVGTCTSNAGLYVPMSTARWVADNAVELFEGFSDAEVPGRREMLARANAYAGYSFVLFGEGWCEAAFDEGPALQPAEIFGLAEERFTRALQVAEEVNLPDVLDLALVGRARARLNMGRGADAATDAQAVTPGFEFMATFSGSTFRRYNRVYNYNNSIRRISVEPEWRGLEWEGVADPRVPVLDTETNGADGRTPLWIQEKYTGWDSDIRLASHDEALLIIAESEGGQTAVDIINQFHERAGLPQFQSTDPAEIREHVLQERSRVLFLESHHMGDLRRLDRFPTGGTHPVKGWEYGSTTCFPMPDVERENNPNVS